MTKLPRVFRLLSTVCLGIVMVVSASSQQAWAEPTSKNAAPLACDEVIEHALAKALFDGLVAGQPKDDCTLDGVSTQRTRIVVTWKIADNRLPSAVVAPSRCVTGAPNPAKGILLVDAPAELRARCGESVALLEQGVSSTNLPPPVLLAGMDTGTDNKTQASRGALDVVAAISMALSAAALVWLLCKALRLRHNTQERSWLVCSVGLFFVALLVRFWIPSSLTNWYAEVLPAQGPMPEARFGPGTELFQAALRYAFPWREATLITAERIVGAAIVPLSIAFFRLLSISLPSAAATGLFLALAPFHVRASASPSEHVLSATLTIALLVSWTLGIRRASMAGVAFSLPLLVFVVSTRVDAWPALIAVPFWGLLRDRNERENHGASRWSRRAVLLLSGLYVAIWGLLGAWAYLAIVIPSGHPGPDAAAIYGAARDWVPQYLRMAMTPPYWYSPLAVVFATVGLVFLAVRRRMLLARIWLALMVSFIPLGRTFEHDALLAARYFLATLPVSLLLSGVGYGVLVEAFRRQWAHAVAWGALLTGTFVAALPAYRFRYTFEDELSGLRNALVRVPAGCDVYALPVREPSFGRDLDGALDVARSPLTLDFPALTLHTLPARLMMDPGTTVAPGRCAVYYETAACSIKRTNEIDGRFSKALDFYAMACPKMRSIVEPEPFWQADVSNASTQGLFGEERPRVALYWWQR